MGCLPNPEKMVGLGNLWAHEFVNIMAEVVWSFLEGSAQAIRRQGKIPNEFVVLSIQATLIWAIKKDLIRSHLPVHHMVITFSLKDQQLEVIIDRIQFGDSKREEEQILKLVKNLAIAGSFFLLDLHFPLSIFDRRYL